MKKMKKGKNLAIKRLFISFHIHTRSDIVFVCFVILQFINVAVQRINMLLKK